MGDYGLRCLIKEQKKMEKENLAEKEETPKKNKCAMKMMMGFIWYMGLTGVLHLRIDNWQKDVKEIHEDEQIQNQVKKDARRGHPDWQKHTKVCDAKSAKLDKGFFRNIILMKQMKFSKELIAWASCWPIQTVYCAVVVCGLWIMCILTCLRYFHREPGKEDMIYVFDIVTLHSWFLLVAFTSTVLFRAGSDVRKLRKFFKTWLEYAEFKDMEPLRRRIKKMTIVTIVIVSLVVAFDVTFVLINVLTPADKLKDKVMQSLSVDFLAGPLPYYFLNETQNGTEYVSKASVFLQEYPVYTACSILLFWLSQYSWMMGPVFFYLICYILYYELDHLKKEFDCKILARCDISCESVLRLFESLRARHAGLCDLIDIVNDIFSGFILVSFLSNLLIACCLTFRIIKLISMPSEEEFVIVTPVIWLVLAFLHMMIICVGSGIVNERAHAINESVYLTSFKEGASVELLNKINVFLSRLNGVNIGFYAWGLFAVNKSSILTMFSSYAAYTVVLITLPIK